MNSVSTIKLIQFPKIPDARGNLSVLEQHREIPFEIKRVYWMYDVPGGDVRWGHAFKQANEVIIAISGSFDVVVNDGVNTKLFQLNRSYYGLCVPKMMWRHLENFSTNSLALIAASTNYAAEDYIRDFDEYVKETNR